MTATLTSDKPLAVVAAAKAAEAKRLFHFFGGIPLPASPSLQLTLVNADPQSRGPHLTGFMGDQEVVAWVGIEEEFQGLRILSKASGELVAVAWVGRGLGSDKTTLFVNLGRGKDFTAKITSELSESFIDSITVPQAVLDAFHVPDLWAAKWSDLDKTKKSPRPPRA